MTLNELQLKISSSAKLLPSTSLNDRLILLIIEIGELYREFLSTSGLIDKNRIKEELANVLWNICDIANRLDIVLDDEMNRIF